MDLGCVILRFTPYAVKYIGGGGGGTHSIQLYGTYQHKIHIMFIILFNIDYDTDSCYHRCHDSVTFYSTSDQGVRKFVSVCTISAMTRQTAGMLHFVYVSRFRLWVQMDSALLTQLWYESFPHYGLDWLDEWMNESINQDYSLVMAGVWQTKRQTDRQAGRQAGSQADRQQWILYKLTDCLSDCKHERERESACGWVAKHRERTSPGWWGTAGDRSLHGCLYTCSWVQSTSST